MNDLLFTKDLLAILQKDNYYGNPKNILVALKKLNLTSIRPSNDIEQMLRGKLEIGTPDHALAARTRCFRPGASPGP